MWAYPNKVEQHVDNHSLNSNFVYTIHDHKDWINMKQNVFLAVVFTEAFALWHAHLGETLETSQGRMPP